MTTQAQINTLKSTLYTAQQQINSAVAQAAALTPDVIPPPPVMTFTAAATGTNECTVSWSGVAPTMLARNGTDTYGGGPWNTGPLTGQPTSGTFKFTALIPGVAYTYTLTYGSAEGQSLSTTLLQPAAPPPPPPSPPTGTAGFGQAVMAPPIGTKGQYPSSKLLWQDTFSGTTLDPTHWSPVMGGPAPVGAWGDSSGKPVVNNGLTLSNTSGRACVNTMDPNSQRYLFSFPSAGWFIQINAKFSDMSAGFWPALWFPTSNPHVAAKDHPEIDIFEGGMIGGGVPPGNRAWEGNLGGGSSLWAGFDYKFADAGVDLSQSFNVYGCEWVPGVSCTLYLNGKALLSVPASNPGGIPVTPDYNFVMTPQNGGGAGGWHTAGPGTGSMYIAEIQVYSL